MRHLSRNRFLVAYLTLGFASSAWAAGSWDGKLVQYGTMREAIGQKQDHGRVLLSEVVKRPHFYAVGALEGLSPVK